MNTIKTPSWVVIIRMLGVVIAISQLVSLLYEHHDLSQWAVALWLAACLPLLVPWRFVHANAIWRPLFAALCAGAAIALYVASNSFIQSFSGGQGAFLVITSVGLILASIVALHVPAVVILRRQHSSISRPVSNA